MLSIGNPVIKTVAAASSGFKIPTKSKSPPKKIKQ
jgi:hypothetical protein